MKNTLSGYEAIQYAEEHDVLLNKYNDPTEDAREGLTPDEARKVAAEDPALIYVVVAGTLATEKLNEAIKAELVKILKTGNSAQKLYVRVRPDGSVNVTEETGWCCSPDEYYDRVPHTLSLEVLKGTRDYSTLSAGDIEEAADAAVDGADEILEGWEKQIEEWIAAGNLEGVKPEAQ